MRIFYYLNPYLSHLTAGLDYVACLHSLGHEVCTNLPGDSGQLAAKGDRFPETAGLPEKFTLSPGQKAFAAGAETIILHDEPTNFAAIYQELPFLPQKRVIAYSVWENEILSPYFVEGLGRVSEVWTCSEFCRQAMLPHAARVEVLPHLVRKSAPPPADLAWAADFLQGAAPAGACVFLAVVDAINPRKNLRGLLTAFNLLQRRLNGKNRRPACLLLKQYRLNMDLGAIPGLISLGDRISAGRMAALYASCTAYVSAHHAEGWGLGLSAAMGFGKPVIATAYSGNMQFMNAENSLPVPYKMAPLPEEMYRLIPLYTPQMRWADPDLPALAEAMRLVLEDRFDPGLPGRAAAIGRRFGPDQISARLSELL